VSMPRAPLAFARLNPILRRLPGVGTKGKDGIPEIGAGNANRLC
jgi:hypothetical protein